MPKLKGVHLAASSVLLDVDTNARAAGLRRPGLILAGASPRLIDEWQLEAGLWNQVRREVDNPEYRSALQSRSHRLWDAGRQQGDANEVAGIQRRRIPHRKVAARSGLIRVTHGVTVSCLGSRRAADASTR